MTKTKHQSVKVEIEETPRKLIMHQSQKKLKDYDNKLHYLLTLPETFALNDTNGDVFNRK